VEAIQSVIAIVVVIGLLLAAVYVLRKQRMATGPLTRALRAERALEVVDRVTLGPQHAIHLVRVRNRQVLVATTPTSCQLLDSFVEGE